MFLLQITRHKTYGIIVSIAVHVRDTRSPSPLPPQSLTLLVDTCHVRVSWALIGCYDNPRDSFQQITGHMQTVLHAQSEGETPESHFGNSVYIYIVCVCAWECIRVGLEVTRYVRYVKYVRYVSARANASHYH